MDYLYVDTGLLDDAATTLKALIDAFDGVDGSADDFQDDIGASSMKSAVHDFATNWKSHREDLTKSMQSVQTMAQKAYESITAHDQGQANEVSQQTSVTTVANGRAQ